MRGSFYCRPIHGGMAELEEPEKLVINLPIVGQNE
jgi:hypothetical protein